MNSAEYSQKVLGARDYIFDKIRTELGEQVEMEKRFIQAGKVSINDWAASLVNLETEKVRIFIMTITTLKPSNLERTAGAKNFKPQMRIGFELYHDHFQGTGDDNSQTEFESDALKLQFAIESNRFLEPMGKIEKYDIALGVLPSSRSLHFAKGEMIINFLEIRY